MTNKMRRSVKVVCLATGVIVCLAGPSMAKEKGVALTAI
jgi:hypothetical protein